MTRRAVLTAVLVLAPLGLSARQTASPSPRNASYTISANLDPINHLILGHERLTWRNTSKNPATELRFHTYWNAWRDASSTWMRERQLARGTPLANRPDDDHGSIDVTAIALAGAGGARDLRAGAHYVAPDDGNTQDQTVLAVPLEAPVAPGAVIDVDITWNAHVPRAYERTGVIGNFFFIGQWFPKIGVLEDAGWNCHQFHAATEFFADFGDYDVSLTVPSGWPVGATGLEQSSTPGDAGATTHRFVEHDVHDFAWTTSPDYLDLHQRLELAGLPAVDVRLLLQPEHRSLADRHFEAAHAALQNYGAWYGPYPYGHVTIVDPVTIVDAAAQGDSVSGMEYPTLIVAGTPWVTPWGDDTLEDAVVHESGHQFWYGLVATNEFEHAWMDEGINTYSTARVLAAAYPGHFVAVNRYFGGLIPWSFDDVPWSRDIDGNRLVAYRRAPSMDAQSTPSWRYWPGATTATTYARTALWLTSLERMLGEETMQKILATYFARGQYRHPGPEDFFAVANEVSGQDLTWFFDAVHRSAATFDYAVGQVTSTTADNGSIDSTVVVRRLGDGVFPVDVLVKMDDGSSITTRWDGKDRWHALHYRRAAHPASVEIDPDHILALDVNYTNNSWTATPSGARTSMKWALRWLTWLQHVLMTYAFFA